MPEPLLQVDNLVVGYATRRSLGRRAPVVPVLKGVSLGIGRGEVVGIVGESGSGKTTLGRALLGLIEPLAGTITFDGRRVTTTDGPATRPLRRRMQMIFQDPMSSLNPRQTVRSILTAPLLLHGVATTRLQADLQASAILDGVGLPPDTLARYPHELSGGQRQRVGIARAIALKPDFVLADEIVSGLDVSTQAHVLRLIQELRRKLGLAMAFISHDLSVVRAICDRVVVLRQGEVAETGGCASVFATPRSPYTRALIAAIPPPVPDPTWLDREDAAGPCTGGPS